MWVEEIEISRTIINWSINSLEKVNWAILPNYEELENLKKNITLDILFGKNNLP
jgi:hypothetical protein